MRFGRSGPECRILQNPVSNLLRHSLIDSRDPGCWIDEWTIFCPRSYIGIDQRAHTLGQCQSPTRGIRREVGIRVKSYGILEARTDPFVVLKCETVESFDNGEFLLTAGNATRNE